MSDEDLSLSQQVEQIDSSLSEEFETLSELHAQRQRCLHRLEEERDTTTPAVFERVYLDYSSQQSTTESRLEALLENIAEEKVRLRLAREAVEAALEEDQLLLEEIELRHRLEEYDDIKKDQLLEELGTLIDSKLELMEQIESISNAFESALAGSDLPEAVEIEEQATIVPSCQEEETLELSTDSKVTPLDRAAATFVTDRDSVPTKEELAERRTEGQQMEGQEPDEPIRGAGKTMIVQSARLIPIEDGEENLTQQELDERALIVEPSTSIGRDDENTVTVEEANVSREHARIDQVSDGFVLRDLGSTNGTYVNGEPIQAEYQLTDGDRILVGPALFLFRCR